MKKLTPPSDSLFLESTRWIDVRSPIEFHAGSVPGALNLPLLTDEERHLIGLTYKQKGQEAAIDLGHQLVSGSVREARIQTWLKVVENNPQSIIFCFRGGIRSQIVQKWLRERGIDRPIIEGGYKALRNFLIGVLEIHTRTLNFQVVSGLTGAGKTAFLHTSGRPFLDLEALACHRGSAFGSLETPQPTQINFENTMAVELLRLSTQKEAVLIENESRMIGRCTLPEILFNKMKSSPQIMLEPHIDDRVENIFNDYILNSNLGTENNVHKFEEFRRSVNAISRKLGGLRAQEILDDLNQSQRELEGGHGLDSNRIWIRKLLLWYYDPLYKNPK